MSHIVKSIIWFLFYLHKYGKISSPSTQICIPVETYTQNVPLEEDEFVYTCNQSYDDDMHSN